MQKDKHMRNGTTLLLLAAVAMLSAACLTTREALAASAQEVVDYNVSPTRIIFPVGEKPNSAGVGMRPTVFNHLVHEKKIDNCLSCHHTGETKACTTCHTMEGKAEGNFITLTKAMHTPVVAKRPKGEPTPQSCVSCHQQQLAQRECAGCHSIVSVAHATRKTSYCAPCHNMTPSITKAQMQQGSAGVLPDKDKVALAAETMSAQKSVSHLTPEDGPYKVYIGEIADKFESNLFAHRRHVESIMEKLNDNKLAQAFHTQPETLCATCHHNAPLSATPPKCGSCHKSAIDPNQPERTSLKAAYHLQCMSCHRGMQVARPIDTSCVTCHKPRAPQRTD